MRILAIRGKNLASLARSFAVELASGELADVGLFAITGPVGSGKSTLLDALCLALFDRTPRLSGRGGTWVGDVGQDKNDWLRANDPRTVLRRDATEGFAEVDFIGRDGSAYRARWFVRRARRRADGRLQDQEMSLRDLAKDTVVASGRRSDVLAAIRQRLGLDFGQFCRSVLLAQGEFHAFLHAAADERARLLETLTGAQLYRRLSRAAHEKRREFDRQVDALRAQIEQCEVLEAAARRKLEGDVEQFTHQLAICDVGIELSQRYVNWHLDAERRREHEAAATVALQRALDADKQAEVQRKQLQQRQRALAAVPRWEVAEQERQQVREVEAELLAVRERSGAAEKAAERARADVDERLRRQFGADASLPALVRDLPQWSSVLERWQRAVAAASDCDRQLPALRDELATRRANRERLVAEADAAAKRQADAGEAVAAAERAAAELDFDRLVGQRRELTEAQLQLREQQAQLLKWREAIAAAEQSRERLQRAEQAEQVGERARVAAQRALAEVEAQGEQVAESVRALEREQSVDHLRAQLVDGQPCVVCGATEHPAAAHGRSGDLDAKRAELASLRERATTARGVAADAEADARHRSRLLAELRAEAERADQRVAELARFAEGAEPVAIAERLAAQAADWQRRDRELAAIEDDSKQRSAGLREARERWAAAEREHGAGRERLAAGEQQERAAEAAIAQAQHAAERAGAVLDELRHGLTPACEGLPGEVAALEGLDDERLQGIRELHELEAARSARADEVAALRREQQSVERRVAEVRAAGDRAAAALSATLRQNRVTEHDVATAFRLGADALREEAERLREVADEVVRRRAELAVRTRHRQEHENHARPTLDAADAQRALKDAHRDRQRIDELRQSTLSKLDFDDTMRRRRAEIEPRLQSVEREREVWRTLDELIGSSSGDAFAVFAQGLTLELLLLEANRRLEELARRYRLDRSPSATGGGSRSTELDFIVVDLELGGTRRSLHTLSGGETFLVSLALALALATLAAPRSRVETLFLDEGFGTLDANNLEIALGALESLQATGCQVGVISHVEGIAERIGAVVEVRPEGAGQSRVVARGG